MERFNCEECKEWVLDDNGAVKRWGAGGPPIPRGKGPRPCEADPPGACPFRDAGLERLTPENEQVLERFEECRAVGFSEADRSDLLFREDAAALTRVLDAVNRTKTIWSLWGRPKP